MLVRGQIVVMSRARRPFGYRGAGGGGGERRGRSRGLKQETLAFFQKMFSGVQGGSVLWRLDGQEIAGAEKWRGLHYNPTFSLCLEAGNARNFSKMVFWGRGAFCGGLGGKGSGGGRTDVGHR